MVSMVSNDVYIVSSSTFGYHRNGSMVPNDYSKDSDKSDGENNIISIYDYYFRKIIN